MATALDVSATQLDLVMQRGCDEPLGFEITNDDDTPFDLTGYDFDTRVIYRDRAIALPAVINGHTVQLTFPGALTRALPATSQWVCHVIAPSKLIQPFLRGTVTIKGPATSRPFTDVGSAGSSVVLHFPAQTTTASGDLALATSPLEFTPVGDIAITVNGVLCGPSAYSWDPSPARIGSLLRWTGDYDLDPDDEIGVRYSREA